LGLGGLGFGGLGFYPYRNPKFPQGPKPLSLTMTAGNSGLHYAAGACDPQRQIVSLGQKFQPPFSREVSSSKRMLGMVGR